MQLNDLCLETLNAEPMFNTTLNTWELLLFHDWKQIQNVVYSDSFFRHCVCVCVCLFTALGVVPQELSVMFVLDRLSYWLDVANRAGKEGQVITAATHLLMISQLNDCISIQYLIAWNFPFFSHLFQRIEGTVDISVITNGIQATAKDSFSYNCLQTPVITDFSPKERAILGKKFFSEITQSFFRVWVNSFSLMISNSISLLENFNVLFLHSWIRFCRAYVHLLCPFIGQGRSRTVKTS